MSKIYFLKQNDIILMYIFTNLVTHWFGSGMVSIYISGHFVHETCHVSIHGYGSEEHGTHE